MRNLFVWTLPLLVGAGLSADDLAPRVGVVEVYGARKVSLRKIRSAIGVENGAPLPPSKGDIEEKLDKISGIVASRLEAACCVDGKSILYVGIEEKDSPHFEFRPEPDGDITLPSEITSAYADFLDSVDQSMRIGQVGESLNLGYSLMENSGARKYQLEFLPLVAKYMETVHRVVRTSHDADQRSMAAYVLQYGPRGPHTSAEIVNDLQFALQDVDDSVRANAMRSLTAMYLGAKLHPDQEISIQPTWFVELLNSIVWSDRHNATLALVEMTEDHNEETLQSFVSELFHRLLRWRDGTI